MKTCVTCNKEFKTSVVINGKKRSLSSRKNCLRCSPFGAGRVIPYKQTTPHKRTSDNCLICNKKLTKKGKYCWACYTKIRRHRNKMEAIKLLGGTCQHCGFEASDRTIAAFEFHHHSDDKEFTIGNIANRKWEVVKREIMKCILLCSNCHRIEHSKDRDNVELLKAVKNYSGNLFE